MSLYLDRCAVCEQKHDDGFCDGVPLKFHGMPDARRYVYHCLAKTIGNDIDSGAGYLFDDLEHEPDRRRAMKAARQLLAQFVKKSVK